MMNKKYDWMAVLQYQPNYTLSDFKDLGVTPENTEFRSRDYYKGLNAVRESDIFKNNEGNFDEKKFDKFYDEAALLYNNYANDEVFNNIGNSYTYDPWEWWNKDTEKTEDVGPKMTLGENPWKTTYGIKGLGIATESPFSIREMAQRRPYYDYTTGEWSDKKPNDFAGIFKSWTAPTLVLATYDQDEIETDENGRTIVHKKGEIKLDKDNLPYYETLGNRDASGKDFLLNEDIYSVDGEGWNKFDFWDADGKRTEGWKVAAKAAARVIPYLLPWGIGEVYAYLKAGQAIAEFMPTFLKSVDAVITNDVMGNEFGRTMNDLVGFTNRMDHGVSDESRDRLITWENVGKMFADVSGQLFEQKAISGLTTTKMFRKFPSIRNNAALSKALAYGYMATTSAEEAYDIFKQAGANDATAGLAMWALIGIYYKLMSADYYKHALFRNSWIDEKNIKEPVKKVADLYQQKIALEGATVGTAKEAAETLNWFQRTWEKVLGITSSLEERSIIGGKTWFSSALSEGVEEVTEELGIDTLKGLAKGLEALGFNVSDTSLDFGFSGQDVLRRYGTSFVGGAFGGAVFHGYNLMDPKMRAANEASKLQENVIGDIVSLVMQNRQNEIYEELERAYKAGEYGSNDLSATKFNVVRDVNGEVVAFEGANGNMSQNEFVYNEVVKTVKFIENVLKENGFNKAVDRVGELLKVDEETAARLLFTGATPINFNASNLILNDLDKIGTSIVSITAKMKQIEERLLPTDAEGGKDKLSEILKTNVEYQDLVEELKYWKDQRDAIYNKQNIFKYVLPASIVINEDIMNNILGFSSLDKYSQIVHEKPFSELTEEQKKVVKREFEEYFNGDNMQVFKLAHIYDVLSEKFTEVLKQKEALLSKISPDDTVRIETVGNELFTKLRSITRINDAIAALEQKTDKTEEDVKKIRELNSEKETLVEWVNKTVEDPGRLMSRVHINDFFQDNLEAFAASLLTWYKSLEGKHKYDDVDLHRFLDQIKVKYALPLIRRGIEQRILETRQELGLEFDEDAAYEHGKSEDNPDEYFWNRPGESTTQDEFFALLNDFYNSLGESSEETSRIYQQIVDLLKNKAGFDDNTVKVFLSDELKEASQDDDGNVIVNSFGISVIPMLNGRFLPEILNEIDQSRSKIIYSDGNDLIKQFFALIGDDSLLPLLNLLEQEEKRIINVGEYTIGNNLYREQLFTLRSIVKAVSAIVDGSYNGINTFLNNYRKNEKLEEYAVITENTAKILHNDLENLKNRINFILELDAKNSGLKLKEQKEVGANMRVKFLSKITNHVYIKDFEKKFKINLEELINENTSSDFKLEDVTTENFDKYEKDIIAVETALYNKMQESGMSDDDIISALIEIYGDSSLYKLQTTKLTKNKDEVITTYDAILYAATIMTLNSNDFYVLYRNAIQHAKEVDPEFDIVPVYGQEYALRLGYAYTKNTKFFNSLLQAIADSYGGTEAYQKNKRMLFNMINVFGGAGTGKSRGVGAMLMYLFPDAEFRLIGPTDTQVTTLLNIFKKSSDSTDGMTINEFKEKVIPNVEKTVKDGKVTINLNFNKETEQVEAENYELQDWAWFGDDGRLRFIVVDEAAMNNSFILKVLSDYAVKNKAILFALGDTKQNTGTITFNKDGKVTTQDDGYEETIRIQTPYLVSNFRAEYRAKADNYIELLNLVSQVDEKIQQADTGKTKQQVNDIVDELIKGKQTVLRYSFTNQGVAGDLITNSDEEFKKLLEKAIATDRRILIVTDSTTSGKYVDEKFNKPTIIKRSSEEAQGGEFDYVFIDKNINIESSGKYALLKDLYTISQRSVFGSIILDVNDVYKNKENGFNIVSKFDPTSSMAWEMTTGQKADYANWRMKALESLTASDKYNENVILKAINPDEEEVKSKKEYVAPETVVKDNPEPEPTPIGKTEVEETPEVKNEEKEEKSPEEAVEETPNEAEETPNPAIPVIKPTLKLKDSAENLRITLKEWDDVEKNEMGLTEEPMEDVPSGTGFFNSDVFFNKLFTDGFFEEQKNDSASLYNYLKTNTRLSNISKANYQKIVLWASRKILQNDFNFRTTGELDVNDQNIVTEFKRLFDKTVLKYIKVSTNGTVSELRAVFTNVDNTSFEIPIGISPVILREGLIAISDGIKPFSIYGRVDYDHTTTKQITIGELRKKYPWLRIPKIGGSLLGDFYAQQTGAKYENAKEYEKRNVGKTMVVITGIRNAGNPTSLLASSIHPITGEIWLGQKPLEVTKIGVQKLLKDENDAILYAAAINYLRSFDDESRSYLEKAGWITNNSEAKAQVAEKLYGLTGNDAWLVSIFKDVDRLAKLSSNSSEVWAKYYEALKDADKKSTLINWAQNERILADLFGNMLRNPSLYKEAWLRLHSKFHNLVKPFGLLIKLDENNKFVIYTDKVGDKPGKIYVSTYNEKTFRPDKTIKVLNTDGKVMAFQQGIIESVSDILNLSSDKLTLDDFNSNRIRMSGVEISWNKDNTVEKFYISNSIGYWFNILSPNKNTSLLDILNSEQFKHHLYGNIPMGKKIRDAAFGESQIEDDYVTMASEWRGELVYVNPDLIVSPNSSNLEQAADIQSDGRNMINRVIETAMHYVEPEYLQEIEKKYVKELVEQDDLTDADVDALLSTMIEEINQYILDNATSTNVSVLVFDEDHTNILIEGRNAKEYAYRNLIRNLDGVELNELVGEPYKHIDVDVITGENGEHYVFFNQEGKLKVLKTKHYNEWKEVLNALNSWEKLYGVGIDVEEDPGVDSYARLRSDLRAIGLYIEGLLTNTVSDNSVKKYWEAISRYLNDTQNESFAEDIQSKLENYLISRINDNEC